MIFNGIFFFLAADLKQKLRSNGAIYSTAPLAQKFFNVLSREQVFH